jgi:DNA anti-recombination protein RmuC
MSTFIRLATKRMSTLKKTIRLLKNCANYPHTPAQAQRIIDEASKMKNELVSAFESAGKSGAASDEFSFE